MSLENVEVIKRLIALWEGEDAVELRDDAGWPARRAELQAIFAAECAFAWIAFGQRTEATGVDGLREVWLDWYEPWESVHFKTDGIIPLGDKVLVLGRQHGRMAGTTGEVELIGAGVYLVREGRIARVEFYANRGEALEALGLSAAELQGRRES
jgi:ketosteroid isomerase-like protein